MPQIVLESLNLEAAERRLCVETLTLTGSIVGAAQILGITRHALKRLHLELAAVHGRGDEAAGVIGRRAVGEDAGVDRDATVAAAGGVVGAEIAAAGEQGQRGQAEKHLPRSHWTPPGVR